MLLELRKRYQALLLYLLIFVAAVALDQATKYLAFSSDFASFLMHLQPVFAKELFPNPYFAFSLHITGFWMYATYLLLVAALVIWFAKQKERSVYATVGFVLILAGAFSNILDRLALGYVRDFVFIFWGNVFNVADVFVVAGIILLAI